MKILIVDAMPLMARCFKPPMAEFSTQAGEPTGLRFGFIRCLRSYKERTEADKVVVCWDSGPFSRLEHLVEDAGLRAKIKDEAPMLAELIALTGYASAWFDDHPAQDVIGSLVKKFAADGHQIVVMSSNRTLWSLVGGRILFWEPGEKRKGRYIGPAEVRAEAGHPPGMMAQQFQELEKMEFRRGHGDPNLLEALFTRLEFKSLMKHVEELALG